jgi:hypothetical protein
VTVTVKILHDDTAESPREHDNLGVMACWHRRYNLGDIQPKEDPAEWLKENAPEGSVVLPLYLMDHSGISISTGPFGCAWDSGQVGWIVATPDAIREAFMVKRITAKIRTKVEECLKSEVSTYDDFLTGNVWGYILAASDECPQCRQHVPKDDQSDSCWGFIGSDALDAMKAHVADEHHAALEAAWNNR